MAETDLISRQAAIDALDKRFDDVPMEQTAEILKLRKDLRELQSAQPEIIRCKDCKHWTNNIGDSELRDNYCNEAAHGFYYRCSGDDFCSYAERREE